MEKASQKIIPQIIPLYESFLHLKTAEECQLFLRDLCTEAEITAMNERWHIAQLFQQGLSYRKISELTGASTTTVTRVAQWVRSGKGGYQIVLERIYGNEQ